MSRTFVVEIESPLGRDEVRQLILTKLSVPLGNAEYRIESQNETMIVYARRYRPYWLPAILLFWLALPLLLLLIEQTDRVMLTLFDEAGSLSVEGRTEPGSQAVQLYDVVQLAHLILVSNSETAPPESCPTL